MAHEEKDEEVRPPVLSHQVVPPVLPQQAEGEQVETLESQEVIVPPALMFHQKKGPGA